MSFTKGVRDPSSVALSCGYDAHIADFRREQYALEIAEFHKTSGLSKTFSGFDPLSLKDRDTLVAFEQGYNMCNNDPDGLYDNSPEAMEKAKTAWKYGFAVMVANDFGYALSESEIPDLGTSALYYLKEALFGKVFQKEILGSLISNFMIEGADNPREQFGAYVRGRIIRSFKEIGL
jgi:hypothetical protein